MTFPQVGAQATLLGAAQFNQQAQAIVANLEQINRASRALDRQGGASLAGFGAAFAGAAIAVGIGAVVSGITDLTGRVIDLGVNVVKAGAEFDYIFGQAAAAVNATNEEAEQLQDTIIGIGQKSSSALNDITRATGDLIKAGASLEDIQNGAAQALNDFTDAAGGEVSSIEAANLIAAAHNATGADFVTIVNQMTGAVIKSTASYRDMVTGGAQLVSTMTALGFSFLDVATALAEMSNAGIKGGRGGASGKSFFLSLESPSKEATKAMEAFGLSLYDTKGQVVEMPILIQRLVNAFGPLAIAAGKTPKEINDALSRIFPGDAIRTAQVLIEEGVEGWNRLQSEIAGVNVSSLADKIRDSLNPQLVALQNTVMGVVVVFTQHFLPVLTNAVRDVNNLLQRLDPHIPIAFGEAIKSILTGNLELPTLKAPKLDVGGATMAAGIVGSFQDVLGPIGIVVDKIVQAFMRVRDAVTTELIPGIIYFKNALMGTTTETQVASSAVDFLADAIIGLIHGVAQFLLVAGNVAAILRQMHDMLEQTHIAGVGLGTVLMTVLKVALIGVAVAIIGLTGAAFALAEFWTFVINVMVFDAQYLIQTVPPIFQSMIASVTAFITTGVAVWTLAFAGLAIGVGTAVAAVRTRVQTEFASIVSFLVTTGNNILTLVSTIWNVTLALTNTTWANIVASVVSGMNALGASIQQISGLIVNVVVALWTRVQSFTLGAWTAITQTVGGALASLIGIMQSVAAVLADMWLTLWTGIGTVFGEAGKVILDGAAALWTWFAQMLQIAGQAWVDAWVAVWNAFVTVEQAGAQLIGDGIKLLLDWIGTAINTAGKGISDAWASVWNALIDIVGKAISIISNAFADLLGTLGGVAQRLGGSIFNGINFLVKRVGSGLEHIAGGFSAVGGAAVSAFTAATGAAADLGAGVAGLFDGVGDLGAAFGGLGIDLSKLFDFRGRSTINDWMKRITDKYDQMRTIWNATHPDLTDPGLPAVGGDDGGAGKGGGAGKKPGGGAGGSAADALKAIKDEVAALTADIPGMTDALQEFLAALEQATPGRLAGMIDALKASSVIIGDMLIASLKITAARMELIGVEQRIAAIDAQIAVLDAQRRMAEIPFQQKLLALKQQTLAIDMQMLPLHRAIALVDKQIALLQRENFERTKARAELEYASLPLRHKIADIEREITDTVDQRLTLTQREAEIRGQLAANALDAEMRSVSKALDKAWADKDVSAILRLEGQQAGLEEQKSAADEALAAMQAEMEQRRLLDELKTIGLEKEKLDILETLKPLELKMEMLDRAAELEAARNAITIAGLQIEKQHLEDLLAPLQEQRDLIEYTTSLIDLQMQMELAEFDQRKLQLDELKAKEDLRQAELNETILLQQQAFSELVLQFAGALAASGAFTLAESLEVAKRMGFWDDQIAKVAELAATFDHVTEEIGKVSAAILAIPTDVTVRVHVVTDTSTGTAGSGSDMASYATGGTVPGPYGQPQLAIVHGGERFLGMQHSTPMAVQAAQSLSMDRSSHTTSTHESTFNVHPPAGMTSVERQSFVFKLKDIVQGSKR